MFMSCHINNTVNIICMFDIFGNLTREVPYCQAPRVSHLHNLLTRYGPDLVESGPRKASVRDIRTVRRGNIPVRDVHVIP
jgi:hypothetical protein